MSTDRPSNPAPDGPEDGAPRVKPGAKTDEAGPRPEKRRPVFRFARLDGRDTLKYEDTADK
jgi:hypothetical protein